MALVRWVVVGAGSVGGVVGGLLADAGHEVTLVARGAHLDAIRSRGLRVLAPTLDVTVRCDAVEAVDRVEIEAGDIVLLAVKAQDSEVALRELSAVADPSAVLVCLQNGLENERLAARRFAQVLSIPVMLPATIVEPGTVAAWGTPHPGILDVGRFPDAPIDDLVLMVTAGLASAGFLSTPRADIARWKRRKLIMNLANAVQALVGLGGGSTLRNLASAEADTCFAVAELDVATIDEDSVNRSGRMEVGEIAGITRGGGSSWQSLVRGAGSIEADYLNGEICLLGRLHDVPTPVNALLQRLANAAAANGDPPGSFTEAELLAMLGRG